MSETFEIRVGQFVALRDKIKEVKERHEKELEPYVGLQEDLNGWLMGHLDKIGAQNVKTSSGTVFTSTRYNASLRDPKAFMDYVITNGAYDLLDRKANTTAVKKFIEDNKSEPPGCALSAVRLLNVRRGADKSEGN